MVTPAGTFLYAVGSTGLLGYSIAPATGVLTALTGSPFTASAGAPDGSSGMLIDRTGKFLYVPAKSAAQILGFSIGSSGALSPLAGSPFSLGTATGTVAYAPILDPSSKFLFVPSNVTTGTPMPGLSAFTIDSTSGALTAVAGSPYPISSFGLAVDPATKYLYATGTNAIHAFTIATSGALTEITGSPFASGGQNPVTLVVNPAGTTLYVGNNGTTTTVNAFSIGANGALTANGAGVSAPNPQAMAIDAAGKFLFVSDGGNNNLNVFSIASSGALTITSGSPYTGGAGLGVITAP
jgi:DNA-binding beta-propeller fold protein YncE